ncbi:MAG TPA: Ku protein [Puia sp.]|jgi:DNA end-binding protein Ku
MRAIWTGAIGFGLVNIPVRIFSATQDSNLSLDMLDKKDHAKIRFKRINEDSGREVSWENIVKAYDYNGKYIVLDDEDFQKASPEKSKIIEIMEFVKEDEIQSIYYETPYYLEPQKSGVKAYALLREALKKSGKVGVGNFVMRTKDSLCVLKPMENAILLQGIRFAQEIREMNELDIPGKSTVTPAEMKMAIALIDQLSSKFDISKFKDTYSAELMKLIQAKAKGKQLKPAPLRVVHSKSKDLMDQLKESLSVKKKKAS